MATGDQAVTGLPQVTPNSPGTLTGDNANGAGPVTGIANPGVKIIGLGTNLDPLGQLRSGELKSLGIAFIKGQAQNILGKLINGFTIGGDGSNKEDVPTAVGNPVPAPGEYTFNFPGVAGYVQQLSESIFGSGKPRQISIGNNVITGGDDDYRNADDRTNALPNEDIPRYGSQGVQWTNKEEQNPQGTYTGDDNIQGSAVMIAHDTMMRWAASNPDHTLFMVRFDIPDGVISEFTDFEVGSRSGNGFEKGTTQTFTNGVNKWNIQDFASHLASDIYQPNSQFDTLAGCFFVHEAVIPSDGGAYDASKPASAKSRGGLVFPYISVGRTQQQDLTLKMYETNASFADMIIRPWAVLMSHIGLVAREEVYKTNIKVMCLTRAGHGVPAVIRKEFTFFNAYPKNVNGDTLTFDISNQRKLIETNWGYSFYTVTTERDVIDNGLLYSPKAPSPDSVDLGINSAISNYI